MKNTARSRQENSTNKIASKNAQNSGAEMAKLTLRDQYLLEIEQIKSEVGDLDQMRAILGMSQRRLCRLLMVDPSAWTRWSKTSAPPHIYQALKWLIELKRVNPDVVAPSDMSSRLDFIQSNTQEKIENLETQVTQIERALTLTPNTSNTTTHSHGFDEATLQSVLNAQEQRFKAEIAQLKAALDQLITKKTPPKKKKSTRKKAKPPKKIKTKRAKTKSKSKNKKKLAKKRKKSKS